MRNQAQTIKRKLHPVHFFVTLLVITLFSIASNSSYAGGSWSKKSFAISGSWSITEKNGAQVLTLDESFETKSAPDLKIFLSRQALSDLNGQNATSQSVLISPLKSNTGAQEYVIPANIDISQFQSLIIHCEQYSKLWGGAAL